ncbi:MAG: MucR family transcriptional regulator [Neomegalonema sp.]|nr:MucR family transcriptional regulator [Neomegalonema sp.]
MRYEREIMNESKPGAAVDVSELLQLTSDIVSSHVSNNPVAQSDLTGLIKSVYATLQELTSEEEEEPVEELKPAVPIKKSITDDYIICLEDGKKLKMLKRHLNSQYNMTPEEYRARWGLPADYPMVAPSYAAKRQQLAKEIGLGRNRTRSR